MPDKKWPPLRFGTLVRTTEPNPKVGDWTREARASRKWNELGVVVEHHDSHGLCYKVLHLDGTCGYYDPSELKIEARL